MGSEHPMPVRIARLRAEIGADPATIAQIPRNELVYQAVDGLAGADVRDLAALVDVLTGDADPVLRRTGLRLLRRGIRSGALAPDRARAGLERLLRPDRANEAGAEPTSEAEMETLAGALRELAQPWAVLDPVPAERLRPFLHADPAVSGAALGAIVRHRHAGLLLDAVTDVRLPARVRRRALGDLGTLAGRGEMPAVLAIAASDPLLFAEPAIACLLSMHRRGLFPRDEAAVSIVDLALTVHSVPVDDVATILYTCRHAALRALTAPGEESRRLALLAALARQAPGDLPVGAAVTGLLHRLPPASRARVDALAVLRELRYEPAEEAVLDALVDLPGPALRTLEAIGGRRTVEVLAGDPPYLAPVRRQALELRWHLTDDPGERRALVARLNPRDLPPRIAADLGGPDPLELVVLRLGFDVDNPADALVRLTRTGDAGTVPMITDLLARVIGDRTTRDDHTVPPEVVTAIRDLGARLHERRRIRPVCLLDAADAAEAGNALVTAIAFELLDRPDRPEREQAIVLSLLSRDTRRVHRLLWHRDRHVRKHAIAALATDPSTTRALSASLAVLTRADDPQTVRQAVTAIGKAGATWAGPLIADCLDHPVMNVKKAAAEALATAGTPAEVPAMLGWLGRHDNPGLRGSLGAALRSVLGNACMATVLAAAKRAADDRTRDLLLTALDRMITVEAVHTIAERRSPATHTVLAMLADGRLRLAEGAGGSAEEGAGTVIDLRDRFLAYGLTPPIPEPSVEARLSTDIATLVEHGWRPEPGGRVVDAFVRSPYLFGRDRPAKLRPLLPCFFELAARRPAALALAVHIGRTPWPAEETGVYVAAVRTLTAALLAITHDDRDTALRWLEAVVPHLPVHDRTETAERIRSFSATGSGRRSVLPLLRRCGAVLTRADLDRALAAARVGPDPWEVEPAVLRQAFDTTAGEDDPIPSRRRLAALIAAYPDADATARPALVDEMVALQPLGAPQWTIAERAAVPHVEQRDTEPPRSAALRRRLLADLDAPAPGDRLAAARTLLTWPEPAARNVVLTAYLAGRIDGVDLPPLGAALSTMDLDTLTPDRYERAARVIFHLDRDDRHRLLPHLLRWWRESGDPTVRNELRRIDPDALALAIQEPLAAGAWSLLDLLDGQRVTATPAFARVLRRIRGAGRPDTVVLVDGPLREPDALGTDLAALDALRAAAPPTDPEPTRAALLETARTGDDAPARRALARLTEIDEDRGAIRDAADPELAALLGDLVRHPRRRMRLLAHRTARRLLDRDTYLRYTADLLADTQPDIVRAALRTVSHGRYLPAIRAAVDLVDHTDPVIRHAAEAALVHYGLSAAPALTHAMARARPDRRRRYADLLERITNTPTVPTE